MDLTAPGGVQVVRGSAQTDAEGTRQAPLLFPAGTSAQLVLPDGTSQPINTLNIRATEYTVGDMGPDTLPGELLPTSGDTYITFQNQTLSRAVSLTGTLFRLTYTSSWVQDRTAAYTVEIPFSGSSVLASLKRIDLTVRAAGQHITQCFPALPNQTTSFTWDGFDAYGCRVQGRKDIEIDVGFVYPFVYGIPAEAGAAFARSPISQRALSAIERIEITRVRRMTGLLGTWDSGAATPSFWGTGSGAAAARIVVTIWAVQSARWRRALRRPIGSSSCQMARKKKPSLGRMAAS